MLPMWDRFRISPLLLSVRKLRSAPFEMCNLKRS
jgi:hypothetical protein